MFDLINSNASTIPNRKPHEMNDCLILENGVVNVLQSIERMERVRFGTGTP